VAGKDGNISPVSCRIGRNEPGGGCCQFQVDLDCPGLDALLLFPIDPLANQDADFIEYDNRQRHHYLSGNIGGR